MRELSICSIRSRITATFAQSRKLFEYSPSPYSDDAPRTPAMPDADATTTTSSSTSPLKLSIAAPVASERAPVEPSSSTPRPSTPFKRLGAVLTTGLALIAAAITVLESRWSWEAWALTGYCLAGYSTVLLLTKRSTSRLLAVLLVATAVASGSVGSIVVYARLTRGHVSLRHRSGQLMAVVGWFRHSLIALKGDVDDELSGPSLVMLANALDQRTTRTSFRVKVDGHATIWAELTTGPRPSTEPKGTAADKKGVSDESKESGSGPGGTAAPSGEPSPPAPSAPVVTASSAPSEGAVADQAQPTAVGSAQGGVPAGAEPTEPAPAREHEEGSAPEETPLGSASPSEPPLTVGSG